MVCVRVRVCVFGKPETQTQPPQLEIIRISFLLISLPISSASPHPSPSFRFFLRRNVANNI